MNESIQRRGCRISFHVLALTAALTVVPALAPLGVRAATLAVVTGNDFRPFSDQGLPEGGLATDLVRAAFARAGDDLTIAWKDWQEGYDDTLAGVYGATFPYYRTDGRARQFLYSEPFYAVERRFFYKPARHPDLKPDAAGVTVCSPIGYALAPLIEAMLADGRAKLERPLDMTRCFELLALDRVDLVPTYEMQGWDAVRATPGLDAGDVATSGFIVESSRLHVIAPRFDPASREILKRFNAGLAALQADGGYDAIVRRHLGDAAPGRVAGKGDGGKSATAGDTSFVGREVRLTLKNGTQVQGAIEGLAQGRYRVTTPYGTLLLPSAEVASLEGSDAAPPPAPSPTPVPAGAETLRIAGARVVAEALVPGLIRGYAEANGVDRVTRGVVRADNAELDLAGGPPDFPTRVRIAALDSDAGLAALVNGSADLALSTRPVREAEAEAGKALGGLAGDAGEHVVGLDALVPLVHSDNPVRLLSRAQLNGLFTGRIRNWAEVGGPPMPVVVLGLDEEAGGYEAFDAAVLQGASLARDAPRYERATDMVDELMRVPGAVAFASQSEAGGAKAVPLAECGLESGATPFGLETEDYPLTRRLFLYLPPARTTPAGAAFVAFATGGGQARLEGLGFASLAIRPAGDAEQAAFQKRLEGYRPQVAGALDPFRARLGKARRLTATFRFATASSGLDARGRRDLRRLAAWLRGAHEKAAAVTLVGYADGRGGYQTNAELARQRARAVADALAEEGVRVGRVMSLGEELPVACDDDATGRARNRRVEVWIEPEES
ncbi:MAG: substrate-binding domain-containing protein [Geminicoccaceae bacterium]|nr:substrate-binding domain-containing protein [Geminicoccaceae bacterium]